MAASAARHFCYSLATRQSLVAASWPSLRRLVSALRPSSKCVSWPSLSKVYPFGYSLDVPFGFFRLARSHLELCSRIQPLAFTSGRLSARVAGPITFSASLGSLTADSNWRRFVAISPASRTPDSTSQLCLDPHSDTSPAKLTRSVPSPS